MRMLIRPRLSESRPERRIRERRSARPNGVAPSPRLPVLLDVDGRVDCERSRRPLTPFLAHLIAAHAKLPQTRERRRTEPATALKTYAAAQSGPATRTSKTSTYC